MGLVQCKKSSEDPLYRVLVVVILLGIITSV